MTHTQEQIGLLPCPFCGGADLQHRRAISETDFGFVKCRSCLSSASELAWQIRAALDAMPAKEVTVQEAAQVILKHLRYRSKDEEFEAALVAHYGDETRILSIYGAELPARGVEWSFRDGFKRMLQGYLRALSEGEA